MLLCKVVRYAFYMWLPLYLTRALLYDEPTAGLVAMTFEIGGVVATGGLGFYKERLFNNSDVKTCLAAIVLGTVSLVLFSLTAHWGMAANILFMALAGAGNCIIDAVMGGTFAASLAQENYPGSTSQISGFINGIGSYGAVVEGILVGLVADFFGWSSVLHTMTLISLIALVLMMRTNASLSHM